MTEFLTAAQAAQRLGVKPATLYAYVSRGVLSRDKAADGRGSLFDSEEVERLARRGRPRRPAGAADITVESAITEITGDRLRYRGHDVTRLAITRSFEDVAELLWPASSRPPVRAGVPSHETQDPCPRWSSRPRGPDGPPSPATPPGGRRLPPWRRAGRAGRVARRDTAAGAVPGHRAGMAATDPLRLHLDPPAVLAAGRSIIAGMVDCLPAPAGTPADQPGPAPDPPIAERLWLRLCDQRPSPALLRALSVALVLLADHELAASTLAARVAASVRADPYAVVATGMGAMSGALHGGASLGAEAMLAAASRPADVPRVIGELLRRGEKVPGFGHVVYRGGDPRAVALLDLVRRAAPKSGELAVAEAVLTEMRQKSLPAPNIDFALATLTLVAGMVRGAGEAVFAVARTAGWIAHALEAYAGDKPLRPRAVYTGRPAADGP